MADDDDGQDEEAREDSAPEGENAEGQEDGEGADGEGEGDESEAGGGKKKLLLILVPLILVLAGAGGAYYMGMLDSLLGVESSEEDHGEEGDHGDKGGDDHGDDYGEEGAGGAFLEIPPMIVNLNTDDGTPRYLRLTVQLELENPGEKEAIEAVIPKVVDQFQTYLRQLRVRDLKGSAGIYRLQMELLWRVNQAVEPMEIKDVLFQEILIQ